MEEPQLSIEFALADLVGDLLNVAYDDKFLNDWLARCAQELNCKNAAILSWESGKPDSEHSVNYGAEHLANPEWCDWFSEALGFYIPEGPCLLEDLMTELFKAREWAGSYDLQGLVGAAPALPKNLKIALISWRRDIVVLVLEHAEPDGWTQADARRIRFIAKHLANANKVLSHVYNCRYGSSIASTIMDASPRGLSVLGPGGHIGYATSKARVIFGLDDGLCLKKGKLRFADEAVEKAFYENIAALEGKGSGTYNVAVERPSGKPPFQLMLLSMRTSAGTQQSVGGLPFLTLFVHNPTDQMRLSISQLQQYFGFTKAEANVARALFKHDSMQKAADSLNVSINTVRTHLRRVYEKTQVNNQAGLMRTLAAVLNSHYVDEKDKMFPMVSATKSTKGSTWRDNS